MKYTSLELSKKLKENGCELEPSTYWQKKILGYPRQEGASSAMNLVYRSPYLYGDGYELDNGDFCTCRDKYPAYDILNDICVKYRRDLFKSNVTGITRTVFDCLQKGEVEKAEELIWRECLFNPKNKDEKENV